MVEKFRAHLLNVGYSLRMRAPFVDYRPDVCADKKKERLFAEVEIERSLHSDHTLHQLTQLYAYVKKSKNYRGILVVPKGISEEATFLVHAIFNDRRIQVVGL